MSYTEEDTVNILASTSVGTFEGVVVGEGVSLYDKNRGSGKDKRASVSVFSHKNVQLGTDCWPINILCTIETKHKEPSTFH